MLRQIKRYGSRKLYDTEESRYVSLEQIGEWVREGQEIQVIDNKTQEDVTAQTLTQVILELGRRGSTLPNSQVLHQLIRSGGSIVSSVNQGVDRLLQAGMDRLPPLRQVANVAVEHERCDGRAAVNLNGLWIAFLVGGVRAAIRPTGSPCRSTSQRRHGERKDQDPHGSPLDRVNHPLPSCRHTDTVPTRASFSPTKHRCRARRRAILNTYPKTPPRRRETGAFATDPWRERGRPHGARPATGSRPAAMSLKGLDLARSTRFFVG